MDIETHTKKVMDNVKTLVETGNFAPPELCKPRKKADLSPAYGPTYGTQLMDPTSQLMALLTSARLRHKLRANWGVPHELSPHSYPFCDFNRFNVAR